jgi:hypothetical protein
MILSINTFSQDAPLSCPALPVHKLVADERRRLGLCSEYSCNFPNFNSQNNQLDKEKNFRLLDTLCFLEEKTC